MQYIAHGIQNQAKQGKEEKKGCQDHGKQLSGVERIAELRVHDHEHRRGGDDAVDLQEGNGFGSTRRDD